MQVQGRWYRRERGGVLTYLTNGPIKKRAEEGLNPRAGFRPTPLTSGAPLWPLEYYPAPPVGDSNLRPRLTVRCYQQATVDKYSFVTNGNIIISQRIYVCQYFFYFYYQYIIILIFIQSK